MKKLFMIIAMALTIGVASAQDYEVVDGAIRMERIYEDTGMSVEDCYIKMASHFATIMNNSNETCKVNTQTKLVYKFSGDVATFSKGLGVFHVFFAVYDLEISIKDNRMRAVLSTCKVNNNDLVNYDGYNPALAYPVVAEYNGWATGVTKKQAQSIFDGIMQGMESILNGIDNALATASEDEW